MKTYGELPDPRPDGLCADCQKKQAVTNDGRFCKPCLGVLIRSMTPIRYTVGRSAGKQQAGDFEPSPWGENAVRAMEGD